MPEKYQDGEFMKPFFTAFRTLGATCALLFTFSASGAENTAMPTEKKHFDKVLELIKKNQFSDAQKIIEPQVQKQIPEALFLQGIIEFERGRAADAYKLFKQASDLGHLTARLRAANMLKEGTGIEKDYQQAFKLFKTVADATADPTACFGTALMLINGEGTGIDVNTAEKYLITAADPEIEKSDLKHTQAMSQLLLALLYKEKAEQDSSFYSKMYYYLELSAARNNSDAWYNLGVNYYQAVGLDNSDIERARLCFLAAERITPAARTEYNLGIVYWHYGNKDESFRWMKLAAEKGDESAKQFLQEPPEFRTPQKEQQQDVLTAVTNKHFENLSNLLAGTNGKSEKNQRLSAAANMILLPMDNIDMLEGWDFDFSKHQQKITESVTADRKGEMRWMSDEYKDQPLEDNLLYVNPTIRHINDLHEQAMLAALKKSKFTPCSPQESKKLQQQLFPEANPETAKCNFWKIRKDLYFNLFADFLGRWQMRYYQFININQAGKPEIFFSFSTPPDKTAAALINGILTGNAAAMNNFAVMSLSQTLSGERSDDDTVEVLLQTATESGLAAAAYNAGVFYKERGKADLAKKYFERAHELAGSTVISYLRQRPEICDRNGSILVKNDISRSSRDTFRIFTQHGKFASALLGHTSTYGNSAEQGMRSMERIIDREKIRSKVYLTIDTAFQSKLEKLVEDINTQSAPMYVYAAAITSSGELLGMAQRPAFDLKKRCFDTPDGWQRGGVQAVEYVFPVPDEWMKLLGSASAAPPADKEKFQFHRKPGVFPVEAQGVVLGLNKMQNEKDPAKTAGQTTSAVNYLLAYIAHAEKKPISKLSIYHSKINMPLSDAGKVKWISFYRPFDGIVVNALGVIESSKPGEKIYLMVRSVHTERNFQTPAPPETVKKAAAGADKAEKIIRQWTN